MQAALGYILAIVVAGILLFSIAELYQRSQLSSQDATEYQMSKRANLDLAAQMERDFRNIGADYPNFGLANQPVILTFDTTGDPRIFEFLGQMERGQAPSTVRYEWGQNGTTMISGTATPVYEVVRFVNGLERGRTRNAFTRVDLDLQAAADSSAILFEDVRQIRIDLESVSPAGVQGEFGSSRFTTVVHPNALLRVD